MSDLVFYLGETIQPADQIGAGLLETMFFKHAVNKAQKVVEKRHQQQALQKFKTGENDPLIQYVYDQANKIHRLLVDAGVPEPAASYGTYAAYHESRAFSSDLYKLHNNVTGIKFAGQKGAVKGNGPMFYAWWPAGLEGWAAAYKHELQKGSNPAGAGSLEDFASRLKKNGYYEDSYDNYLNGIKRARLVLKVIPAADRASTQPDGSVQAKQDLDIPGSKDYGKFDVQSWWDRRSTLEKGGIIAAAVIALAAAVKK